MTNTEDLLGAPKLDRLVEFDERSRSFAMRPLLATSKPRRSYTWKVGVSLDQGNEGACVGFGWAHELAARPKVHMMDNATAFSIYRQAKTLDAWAGENYEGTSVLAGAKAVKLRGYISEYRWCFSEDDLALTVGYKGPVVLGAWWRTGMDQLKRDSSGKLWASYSGPIRGGHCFITHGYNVNLDAYKMWNSWGPPSEFWMKRTDVAAMLADDGEACVPVVRL